jgi:hypothetical protein
MIKLRSKVPAKKSASWFTLPSWASRSGTKSGASHHDEKEEAELSLTDEEKHVCLVYSSIMQCVNVCNE